MFENARVEKNTKEIAESDIIDIVLRDHKPLKAFVRILKSSGAGYKEKLIAFEDLAPLLFSHMEPEELSLYAYAKERDEQRLEAYEQEVEHNLIEQLLGEVSSTDDEEAWMAKVKVLGDLLAEHIDQEERYFLPELKRYTTVETRKELGERYLKLQLNFEDEVQPNSH